MRRRHTAWESARYDAYMQRLATESDFHLKVAASVSLNPMALTRAEKRAYSSVVLLPSCSAAGIRREDSMQTTVENTQCRRHPSSCSTPCGSCRASSRSEGSIAASLHYYGSTKAHRTPVSSLWMQTECSILPEDAPVFIGGPHRRSSSRGSFISTNPSDFWWLPSCPPHPDSSRLGDVVSLARHLLHIFHRQHPTGFYRWAEVAWALQELTYQQHSHYLNRVVVQLMVDLRDALQVACLTSRHEAADRLAGNDEYLTSVEDLEAVGGKALERDDTSKKTAAHKRLLGVLYFLLKPQSKSTQAVIPASTTAFITASCSQHSDGATTVSSTCGAIKGRFSFRSVHPSCGSESASPMARLRPGNVEVHKAEMADPPIALKQTRSRWWAMPSNWRGPNKIAGIKSM
ncbi:hypothetical protein cyc_06605 [Cyclospora cayetanensis]|uniref:Uncharacterized protein n=1 Tax=Cyclospora cayetanensis TaxID=88456 RepID=A0A1D3CW74_9EIME|nr:hypothetical protein cyc_06605 [Cyclospora cayetanensis]